MLINGLREERGLGYLRPPPTIANLSKESRSSGEVVGNAAVSKPSNVSIIFS